MTGGAGSIYLALAATVLAGCAGEDRQAPAEIGSSLNEKSYVAFADVPEDVMAAARAARPSVDFTEAEKEVRGGVVYYDVGGTDAGGGEVELDIMQDGGGWRVVEIQRDISLDQTPAIVKAALFANAPDVEPARIIESDQGDGVVIYEFFTRVANGEEQKYEVKFENDAAEFLAEEWVH